MEFRRGSSGLVLAAAAVALCAAITQAHAGGFALREQSSDGQGSSYAGVAAGGSLSSMFWNPATMTQIPGIQTEIVATGIFPYAANTPAPTSPLFPFGGTGNTAENALVPSGYFSWQVNPDLWLGLSINSPFGLSVEFPELWAGRDYAANKSHLKTYNFTPSFAYALNNWISVGFGVQVQYGDALLNKGVSLGAPPFPDFTLSGTGWGYGVTAGVTLTPTPNTSIGLGYRSQLNQKIKGDMTLTGALAPFSAAGVNTTLKLPDMVSLGLRQRLDAQWTLLGTVEWTNWSRIGTSTVYQGGAPVFVGPAAVTLPFQFKDGWYFALGAEYQWNDRLTLRAGAGYEKSPITDMVRIPLLPDNDRTWLSGGLTYKVTNALSFDFAYSHLFVKNSNIDVSAASGNPWFDGVTYQGNVKAHIDIVSVALKYRFDEPPPAPRTTLYTK